MKLLNVYHASYCSSMLTSWNLASLGEPLQTLSELVNNGYESNYVQTRVCTVLYMTRGLTEWYLAHFERSFQEKEAWLLP